MPWPLIVAFIVLPFYWGYLLVSTRPQVIYDAIGYVELGRLIAEKGLSAYFHAGLQREPFFPLLIASAMKLESWTTVAYPYFVKGLLMVSLAVVMTGVYRLVRLLGAGRWAAGFAAFYTGLSPSILNATLWLWSEAAALPWAIWGVVFFIRTWRAIRDGEGLGWSVCLASATAVCFLGLTMVKAAVTAVFPAVAGLLIIAAVVVLLRRAAGQALTFFLCGAISLGMYAAAIEWYKFNNMMSNGYYEVTDRVDWALYGNTVRRLAPLTPDKIAQAVLSVPRLGFCEQRYGRDCSYWSFVMSDEISKRAVKILTARGLSAEERRKFFWTSSFQLMAAHPFQQAAFSALEASKMLFWENRLYFVQYPDWLARFYSFPWTTYVFCFGWALLSLVAFLYAFWRWLRWGESGPLLTAWIVFCFAGAYSVFFIDIRYGLPMAPLFIVLTAVMCSRLAPRTVPPAPEPSPALADPPPLL